MNEYNIIKRNIRNIKCNNLFDPIKLDSLELEYRKKIEYEIVMNIISGNYKYYKYIPYLMFYDNEKIYFKYIDINKLSEKNLLKLYIEICKKNHNIDLLVNFKEYLINTDESKKEVYSLLYSEFFNEIEKEKIRELVVGKKTI